MSIVRQQASIATLAVSGSRVAGLIREMVFAFFFGAGPAVDAFIAAFRIPNLLRDLFAEGALSTSFVTVFSKKITEEGDDAAYKLGNQVFTFILMVMGSLTLLGIIFSPTLVHLIASGFTHDKFLYTVWLNRLLFPFILFVSLAAIAMGMLNSKGKFALPQSASTFFNLTSIVAGLTLAYLLSPHMMRDLLFSFFHHQPRPVPSWQEITRGLTGMALGTLLGGVVQWLVQMPALWKLGFRPRWNSTFSDDGFRKVMRLTLPAILGGAAVQVNVLINTHFASYLADGSIAWLNYAFRLMQFPIGIFGVAVATATTPAIARYAALKDVENFKKTLRESTQMTLFLCIPSALGLILLAEPILGLIYQHGRFSAFDTTQAAHALMAYAVGLSSYALIKIYQPAFLVHNDARTPMILSLISIFLNLLVNWFLIFVLHFQHWGLALGTSVVALWNGFMLIFLFRKKVVGIWSAILLREITKIILAAVFSTGLGWFAYHELFGLMGDRLILQRLLLVFIPIGLTTLFYYFVCSWMKITEVTLVREFVFSKFRSK